ncbi:MAG TPA: hypothetical protein VGM19_08995 [Armatimonadota bacterium]|jgi:hypothetical protein
MKKQRTHVAPAPVAPALDWRDLLAAAWVLLVVAIFLRQFLAALS